MQQYIEDDDADGDMDVRVVGAFSTLENLGEYSTTHKPDEWCEFYVSIYQLDDPKFYDWTSAPCGGQAANNAD